MKYLGKDNSIGFVSYSDNVTINLPIGKYDTNQQSMFVGAIDSLQANGGTATFDGIAVAIHMLQTELQLNPDLKPLIFVLSDGETNEGHSLNDIRGLIETYKIPIYTIGYNANIKALESISSINEVPTSMQIQMMSIKLATCSMFKCKLFFIGGVLCRLLWKS